jgi:hypothetical protein
VNLKQLKFKLSKQRNYNHIPEALGRCEKNQHVNHTSDPLSKDFKKHIKYKLDTYTRYKTIERDLNDGNNGTAGGSKRSKFPSLTKNKWHTLLGK